MDDLGKYLGVTTIHNFFLEHYNHKGSLCSPNLVSLDKFQHSNVSISNKQTNIFYSR
jgi:hypothetical protein